MQAVINTRRPKSIRTINYTDSMHARREILDLDNFTAYNGVFDASTETLTVYSQDGAKAVVFHRRRAEEDSFLELSTCNVLVALKLFPNVIVALEETFKSGGPGEEPTVHSFCFAKTDEGTKVVLTN